MDFYFAKQTAKIKTAVVLLDPIIILGFCLLKGVNNKVEEFMVFA